MTTPKRFVIALTGILVLGLVASSALGQYYVPLRYDLRYSLNPGYVTAIPYAQGPARPNPYAFGSSMYSGLDLTGNVRAGKSFQGNTPYNQTGSQLSANTPSTALSNFARDSVGIGDIGTGVEYGLPAPYFPGSASVTSIGTATRRFAPTVPGDRAPYTMPNYNAANVGLIPFPTAGYYAGSTPPPDVPAAQLQTMKRGGLYLPRGSIEWVNSISGGGQPLAPTAPVPNSQVEELSPEVLRMDMRLGVPSWPTDVRIGLPPELGGQMPVVPGGPADLAAQRAAAEARARAMGATEGTEKAPLTTEDKLRQGAMNVMERGREPSRPTTGAVPAATPGMSFGQGAAEENPVVPAAPSKFVGAATFPEYIARAHEEMKLGHFGGADALYEAAMVMDASQPSALFGRVFALMADYRYMQASLVLDRSLRLHPDWAAEIPDIKAVYPKPEILTRIVGDLRTNLEDRPSNVEANLLLGYVNIASGKKDEAKPFLKQVATIRGEKPGSEQSLLKAIEAPAKPK